MSVFPDTFEADMSHPYDSFNVEDLHTVDEGVLKNMFPLLEDKSKPFDFLIGHFLGVDHVGHRVGPDHPSMKAKLEQMNRVLTRVVELLDDDTLLIVLGDHGMDRSGDHGGDGTLETSSALWIYSKVRDLSRFASTIPSGLLQYKMFPGSTVPHRSVQQIDLLPSLSLLLGLPIPFNNLGSIIPELFWRNGKGKDLLGALELNAAQIRRYLDAYRASSSGGELDDSWHSLQSAWTATQVVHPTIETTLITLSNFNRVTLEACRSMWAQFSPLRMAFGLALIGVSLIATWAVYSGMSKAKYEWQDWLVVPLHRALRGVGGGALLGFLGSLAFESHLHGIDSLDCIIFAGPLVSCILVIVSSPPTISLNTLKSFPLPLFLHTIAFFSNSFTFWEDRIVVYLAITSIIPFVLTGFTAPTARLRSRILGFSFLFAACVRLMSISTVCREEQQPYCHVTFYSSSSLPTPPLTVLVLALPTALCIPVAFKRVLQISRSHLGLAQVFLPSILTPTLVGGAAYWLMEWADSAGVLGEEWAMILRIGRTWMARLAFAFILLVGGGLWWSIPLCLQLEKEESKNPKVQAQLKIIGFANAFGSSYLLFWSIFFGVVYITTQLTGQVILGLGAVALVSFLEVIDSVRDVQELEDAFASAKPSLLLDPSVNEGTRSPVLRFSEIVPIALLGLVAFYGTGHQSTIPSIQWKSAFLLTPTVTYPFSPVTVVLNSFGPLFLAGLAAPLLALWNRSPHPAPSVSATENTAPQLDVKIKGEATLSALGMMMYFATLLFGTAVSAAVLRRHLMVWKVFAPRFMAGVVGVLVVDVAVLVGVGIGVARVGDKVNFMFRSAFPKGGAAS